MTVLGFDERSSAFIATTEPKSRTDSVVLNLSSKLYSRSLSFIVTADITQATVLIIAFIAGLCSVLLFLSIVAVQRSKRTVFLLAICISLAMPGFSHLLATPYPVGIATFALLLYIFSTMKFLSFQPDRKHIALAFASMAISMLTISITRAEVVAAMIIFSLLTFFIQRPKSDESTVEKLKPMVPLALSMSAITISPQIQTVFRSLFGGFALQPTGQPAPEPTGQPAPDWVLTHGRVGNILAAPFVYFDELVTQPWLKNSHLLELSYQLLLVLLFVIVGYLIIKDFRRRKTNRLVATINASLIILLPALSALGALRLLYVIPFGLMLIVTTVDDTLNLRLPLLLAAVLAIIGNGTSMALFASDVESFHFYYFDLNPITYYLIGQTSIVLMIVSLFAILYQDVQSTGRGFGGRSLRLVRAKAVRKTS